LETKSVTCVADFLDSHDVSASPERTLDARERVCREVFVRTIDGILLAGEHWPVGPVGCEKDTAIRMGAGGAHGNRIGDAITFRGEDRGAQ